MHLREAWSSASVDHVRVLRASRQLLGNCTLRGSLALAPQDDIPQHDKDQVLEL